MGFPNVMFNTVSAAIPAPSTSGAPNPIATSEQMFGSAEPLGYSIGVETSDETPTRTDVESWLDTILKSNKGEDRLGAKYDGNDTYATLLKKLITNYLTETDRTKVDLTDQEYTKIVNILKSRNSKLSTRLSKDEWSTIKGILDDVRLRTPAAKQVDATEGNLKDAEDEQMNAEDKRRNPTYEREEIMGDYGRGTLYGEVNYWNDEARKHAISECEAFLDDEIAMLTGIMIDNIKKYSNGKIDSEIEGIINNTGEKLKKDIMRTLQNTSASSPKDPKTWMNYNWGAAFRTGQDGKEGYRIAWLSHHCSDFDGDSGLCGAICKNSLAAEFFELYEAERAQYFANKNSGASQD